MFKGELEERELVGINNLVVAMFLVFMPTLYVSKSSGLRLAESSFEFILGVLDFLLSCGSWLVPL